MIVGEVRVFPDQRTIHGIDAGEWDAQLLGDRAEAPSGGLETHMLRGVLPIGHLRKYLPKVLRETQAKSGSYFTDALAQRGFPASDLQRGKRMGRVVRDDRWYAELAARYVVMSRRKPASPIPVLANSLHLATSTVSDALGEARRRGLLTPPPPGRPGGQLTDKALAILTSQSDAAKKGKGKGKR